MWTRSEEECEPEGGHWLCLNNNKKEKKEEWKGEDTEKEEEWEGEEEQQREEEAEEQQQSEEEGRLRRGSSIKTLKSVAPREEKKTRLAHWQRKNKEKKLPVYIHTYTDIKGQSWPRGTGSVGRGAPGQ